MPLLPSVARVNIVAFRAVNEMPSKQEFRTFTKQKSIKQGFQITCETALIVINISSLPEKLGKTLLFTEILYPYGKFLQTLKKNTCGRILFHKSCKM